MPLRPYLYAFGMIFVLASCRSPEERRSALVPSRVIAQARPYGLVDVRAAIPDIRVDLRYASTRNVSGHPIYPSKMPCLLRTSTVERLRQAQATLKAQGYGLRVWDAWRPPEAQKRLYAAGGRTGMFLDPRAGWSRHCGGVSVDATLVDAHGVEQRLPTNFDEDMDKAGAHYTGGDPVVAKNLEILQDAMRKAGLLPLPGEWWHFDDCDFLYSPIGIITGKQVGVLIPEQ